MIPPCVCSSCLSQTSFSQEHVHRKLAKGGRFRNRHSEAHIWPKFHAQEGGNFFNAAIFGGSRKEDEIIPKKSRRFVRRFFFSLIYEIVHLGFLFIMDEDYYNLWIRKWWAVTNNRVCVPRFDSSARVYSFALSFGRFSLSLSLFFVYLSYWITCVHNTVKWRKKKNLYNKIKETTRLNTPR